MADLLILADGGGDIGFGHLMRCLAIKNAWNNGTARLIAQMEGGEPVPDGTETFDWLREAEKLKKYVSTNTILLVDSYRPNVDFYHQLKKMFPFVVVLDDYNRIVYPVDLVVCPGIYGKEMDYNNQSAMSLGGAEYVILRPEILTARQLEIKETIKTILVTFGGSQQDEILFQKVIDLLEGVEYQAIIVTGSEQLAKKLSAKTSQVYGRLNPVTMAEIMASVDIAISAAGQTLNELAWLGVPTISVKTGEDQHRNWDYYNKHDLSLGAVIFNAKNLESILIEAVKNATAERRLDKFLKLRNLLTVSGAEKICSTIESIRKATNE